MTTTLTTRTDATQFVTDAIEAGGAATADEFFVDQIVDALYDRAGSWSVDNIEHDEFWAVVWEWMRSTHRDRANTILTDVASRTHAQWRGRNLEIVAPDGHALVIGYDEGDGTEPGYSWSEYSNRTALGARDETTTGGGTNLTDIPADVDHFLTRHSA